MKITPLSLQEIQFIEATTINDPRGTFMETWHHDRFHAGGVNQTWAQDNLSRSTHAGTIRGLHWQLPPNAQAKLVRVVKGSIFDVVVDVRLSSPTFGQHLSIELSDKQNQAIFVPVGYAHGFCTLEDDTIVTYKTSSIYNQPSERCLNWSSPELSISWPALGKQLLISTKDELAPSLVQLKQEDLL